MRYLTDSINLALALVLILGPFFLFAHQIRLGLRELGAELRNHNADAVQRYHDLHAEDLKRLLRPGVPTED